MGGTIARLVVEGYEVTVAVMTGHGKDPHPLWDRSSWDVVRSEARNAMNVLGVKELLFSEIPAALVSHTSPIEVNQEAVKIIETPLEEDAIPDEAVIRDADDRPVLRAAVKANADVLITGDNDFLKSGLVFPKIVSPAHFLVM